MVNEGAIEKNPARRVAVSMARPTAVLSFLTLSEIEKLLGSIDQKSRNGKRDSLILSLMLFCGFSQAEIVNLKFRDIIKIKRKYFFEIKTGEKEKEKVQIRREALAGFKEYLKLNRFRDYPDSPIFISYSNRSYKKKLSLRGISELIVNALNNSDIDKGEMKMTPSIIKHSSAIFLAKKRMKASDLQIRFKFKSSDLAKRYIKLAKEI
jgi:site-specific recombinase XerD